jgi:hypothetical protein
MKLTWPKFVVALAVLLLCFGAARATPGYGPLPLPAAAMQVRMEGCIPCAAKCNKCIPLTGRGVFASRDACLQDCTRRGNLMLPPKCGIYGGSDLCR